MKSPMMNRCMICESMNQYPTYSESRLMAVSVLSSAYVKIQKMMKRIREMACAATKWEV